MTRILFAIGLMFTSTFSYAGGFSESKILARAYQKIEPTAEDPNPVDFEFFVLDDETAWVRAQFPEWKRFVKYGPWTIDRNKPQKVSNAHRFFGVFEYKGDVYLVGMPKPYVSHKSDELGTKEKTVPSEAVLYKVFGEHGKMPIDSYVKNLKSWGIGGVIYFGFSYIFSELASHATVSPSGVFAGAMVVVTSSIGAFLTYSAISPTVGAGDLATSSKTQILAPKDGESEKGTERRDHLPVVRRIDSREPFSAENTAIIFQGNIVRSFRELSNSRACSEVLGFRPAKNSFVSFHRGYSQFIE